MSQVDRETSHLLPMESRKMQQHVWVQGRLVPVRSLSGVDLRSPKTESAQSEISSTTSSRRKERETDGGVHDGNESLRSTDKYGRSGNAGGSTRRRSIEEANNSAFDHDDDETAVSSHGERKELNAKYNKPRGFGIGGVGNIRRPTEVIHGPSRMEQFARGDRSALWRRDFNAPPQQEADKQKFSLRDVLKRGDRKGKGKVS